jgi:hypothetical protein
MDKVSRARLSDLSVSVFGDPKQWKFMTRTINEEIIPKHVQIVHKNGKRQTLTIEKAVAMRLHDGNLQPSLKKRDIILTPNEALDYLFTANCAKAVYFLSSSDLKDSMKDSLVRALVATWTPKGTRWYPFIDVVFTNGDQIDASDLEALSPEQKESLMKCTVPADKRNKAFAFTRYIEVSMPEFVKALKDRPEDNQKEITEFYQLVYELTGVV